MKKKINFFRILVYTIVPVIFLVIIYGIYRTDYNENEKSENISGEILKIPNSNGNTGDFEYDSYIVSEEISITDLALKLKKDVRILQYNNPVVLKNPLLKPGTRIIVYKEPVIFYKIKDGDTLSMIASKFQVSQESIININSDIAEENLSNKKYLVIKNPVINDNIIAEKGMEEISSFVDLSVELNKGHNKNDLINKETIISDISNKRTKSESTKNNYRNEDNSENIEVKVARVLANMEYEGIHVSKKALEDMSDELDERIKILEASIHTLAGSEFNIASPKQLGIVLFEDLGLPPVKKTKTGYSTSVEVLEQLQHSHEIIPLIMEYRVLTKLNSTYAKGLVKDITRKGKIHTRYEQTLTQTGRLSSVNPNLQNIPTRIEEGKKIRKAFIPASDDRVILSIDYSQIELRVLAHMAQDKGMIDAFTHDLDIHTKTASEVNGVSLDEVTPTMRREAKAVNFGIVYGISDFGLSNNLGITRKRAKEFIDKYLETFSGVNKYMTDIVEFAKEHGYVETLYNRRRALPEINAKNKIVASLNARLAMNTPIQGTAADIIKLAMINAFDYIEKTKVDAKLLLQVHDELIFDVNKDVVDEFTIEMVKIMEEAVELDVKLKAEASSGSSWYDTK